MADDLAGAYVRIQPDLEAFRADLDAKLRQAMAGASAEATVGVDTGDAQAKLDAINAELTGWGERHGSASADVDTGRAQASLDDLNAKLDAFGRKRETADANIDTSGGERGIGNLLGALAALGPAAVAAAATAAGALAVLPGILAGAAVGAGALFLGVSGVAGALKAMDTADSQSAANATKNAQQRVQAAQSEESAANAVISANEALRNARQQAADSAVTNAQAVARAEQSLASAEQAQKDQAITGAEQVAAARRTLADALTQQATDRETQAQAVASAEQQLANAQVAAARSVQSAEDSLHSAEEAYTQSLYTEQQAQQAVIDAREAAHRQLESYQQQLADGALQQRQSALDVAQAQENLNAILANPKATDLQRQQAQLAYDEAVQRQKDQAAQYEQLQQDAAKATAAGVDGATAVLNAQHQVTQAQQAQADAERRQGEAAQALAAAQTAAAQSVANAQQHLADVEAANTRQQEADAQRVAAAQQSLTDTLRTTSEAQVRATQAVAAAVQQLSSTQHTQGEQAASSAQRVGDAQRSLKQAQDQYNLTLQSTAASGGQATAAQTALAIAMGKLGPAGQEFVTWVHSTLMPTFESMKAQSEAALLPGIQAGVGQLLTLLPSLMPILDAAGQGIGIFVQDVASFLTSPTGSGAFLNALQGGSLFMSDLGTAGLSVIDALTNMASTGTPVLSQIGQWTMRIAADFQHWADDGGAQRFFAFLSQVGPQVVGVLGDVARLFGDLGTSLAPLAPVELGIINDLLRFLDGLVRGNPALAGFLVTFGGIAYEVSKLAGPLGPVMKDLGNLGGIAGGGEKAASALGKVVGLGGSLVRIGASMGGALASMGEALVVVTGELWAMAAAATGLDAVPLVALIVGIIAAIVALVVGLYELVKHWSTVWDAIKSAAVAVWDFITEHWRIFAALFGPFGWLALAIDFLVTHWSQVWSAIQSVASTIWGAIQTAAGLIWGAIMTVIGTVISVLDTVIRTVWGGLSTFLSTTWGAISSTASTVFGAIGTAIHAVWTGIDTVVRAVWTGLKTFLTTEWNGFVAIAQAIWTTITSTITSVWGGLTSAASTVWDTVKGVFQDAVNAVVDVVDFFIDGINKILGLLPGVTLHIPDIPHWTSTGAGSTTGPNSGTGVPGPHFAAGGQVPGSGTSDTVPAMLTPGEYVLRRDAVATLGVPLLERLNMVQHRGLGGLIGDIGGTIGGAIGDVGGAISGVARGVAGDAAGLALDGLMGPVRAMLAAVPVPVVRATGEGILNAVHDAIVNIIKGNAGSPSGGGAPGAPATPSGNAATAQAMAVPFHWDTGAEWNALWNVGNRESGWNASARNPSSGAYGIPQALPGEKMASAGPDWRTNPATQIAWMLGYIRDRYGDPVGAWAHEMSAGWYGQGGLVGQVFDDGGWLEPGRAAVNTSARPEPVFSEDQWALLREAAAAGEGGDVTVRVFIGERELTDIVDTQVERSNRGVQRRLTAGLR